MVIYEYEKHKRECELDAHSELIEKEFEQRPPQSIKEARARIGALTHLTRGMTQVSEFLKKGFRCIKTGSIPSKADPVAQKEFLENTMKPLISAAEQGKIHLYYADAAHFVLGAFLGYLWCKLRVLIRTPSGRQRYNVLGAYNAITRAAITRAMVSVTNTTYINSSSVVELLGKLSLLHPGGGVKIILDNASY